jgi:hypothetical protein
MVGPDALLVALDQHRCEPERLTSIHPSRFSAASTRAALAMLSTVEHGMSNSRACQVFWMVEGGRPAVLA